MARVNGSTFGGIRSRIVGVVACSGLLIGTVAGGAAGSEADSAAPAAGTGAASGACDVTSASLTWGVKESFRAYISGSIANGSWEASDGARYEIPNFVWEQGTGSFDPETGAGQVSFPGTIHFTGHGGVLDLTLANPTVEVSATGEMAILMDATSTDMEGATSVDEKQVWFGDSSIAAGQGFQGGSWIAAEVPVTLTDSGAEAFAGFYEPGIALDPISLQVETGDCVASGAPTAADAESTVSATPAPGQPTAAPLAAPSVPWLPLSISGVALFVIGLTVGLLIGGRRSSPAKPSTD